MKRGTRRRLNILGGTLTLASRVIFTGLVLWGFVLFTRNVWVMW